MRVSESNVWWNFHPCITHGRLLCVFFVGEQMFDLTAYKWPVVLFSSHIACHVVFGRNRVWTVVDAVREEIDIQHVIIL